MAENFRHGMPEELSGWLYKKQKVFPTKKKRYFKLASQVLSSHVRNVSQFNLHTHPSTRYLLHFSILLLRTNGSPVFTHFLISRLYDP